MDDLLECYECGWLGYQENRRIKKYEQFLGDTTPTTYHCPDCDSSNIENADYSKTKAPTLS